MKIIFISFLLLAPLIIFAQVGINTDDPQAALDVRSLSANSDSILTLRDSMRTALFNIKNSGRIHTMNTKERPTLLDIRSNTNGDVIAIGNTSMSHTEAGEGVLKFDPETKSTFLSVDTGWFELNNKPLRVSVSIEPTENSIFESDSTKIIKNWTVVSDLYQAANPETGYFTAPHNGIYGAYVNIVFERAAVKAQTFIRIEIHSSHSTDDSLKGEVSSSIFPFYIDAEQYPIVLTTNYFKLDKGDTLYVQVYHNVGTDLKVLHQYTYLSIVEF